MKKYYIGDSCLCWSIGDSIDSTVSAKILAVYRNLKKSPFTGIPGVLDIVPCYKALAVHFDPLLVSPETVEKETARFFELSGSSNDIKTAEGRLIEIPVIYNGEDLGRMAALHNMTVREVIDIHKKPEYTVAMVGFKPYFPYLIGLDKRIETPRLESPRKKVPSGAVAVGGAQTGIYPVESPGGWNLVGLTDPALCRGIEPGDRIIFKEVDTL